MVEAEVSEKVFVGNRLNTTAEDSIIIFFLEIYRHHLSHNKSLIFQVFDILLLLTMLSVDVPNEIPASGY